MTDKRVGVRIDVGATGLENIRALSKELRDAGVDTTALDAKADALAGELRGLNLASQTAAKGADALGKESRGAAGALREQGAAAAAASGNLDGVTGKLKALAGLGVAGILGGQTAQLLKGVAETADEFANLQAKVRLTTGEGPAFQAAMQGIADVALRTSSSLDATAQLFTKLAQAGKEMGIGQEQALALTESINQAVQLSGASAASSEAAITQLVQGLQGGALRGDEFNSVMEQAPRLAQALAAGLGVTTGELRKMAEAGKLSADVVIRALQSQSEVLKQEFGALPSTIGRSIENLRSKWSLFIGSLNSSSGATASVASGIDALANHLDELVGVAVRAGSAMAAALAVQGVSALRSMATEMAATGAASGLLTRNLNAIPKSINIVVAAVGFEVAYELGRVLHENSEAARKLGVATVAFITGLVESLRALEEAAGAIFSADTFGAVIDRFEQRMARQREIFQLLWADAKQSPEVVRAAAAAAAADVQRLGDAASTTGATVAAAGQAGAAGLGAMSTAAAGASGAVAAVGTAGATAATAIGALTEAAKEAGRSNTILTTSLTVQADALVKVALAGSKTAEVLRTELPEALSKLSAAELAQFKAAMTQALAATEDAARRTAAQLGNMGPEARKALALASQAAEATQVVLQAVGAQAAKSLGVDLAAASNRVSAGFRESADELATLIQSLPALAKQGVDTGAVVGRALGNMISGAKNQAEIDAIIDRAQALQRAGTVTGQVLSGVFIDAKNKAQALREEAENATPGMAGLGEAARKAGVDIAQLTGGITTGGRESIRTISDLVDQVIKTGVSAERASPVLADAFNKRVQAAATKEELQRLVEEMIKARDAGFDMGGVITRELEKARSKAEQLNPELARINDAIRKMGGVPIGQAGPNGSTPTLRPGGPGAIDEEPGRIRFFAGANANTDKSRGWTYGEDGFVMQNGQRFTAGGQLQPPDNSGDWRFVGDVRARGSGSANRRVVRGQGYWIRGDGGSTIGTSGGATGAGSLGGFAVPSAIAGAGSPASPSDGPQAGARRIEVNLRLNGGVGVPIGVASDADAERLQTFLRQLEFDAWRAA